MKKCYSFFLVLLSIGASPSAKAAEEFLLPLFSLENKYKKPIYIVVVNDKGPIYAGQLDPEEGILAHEITISNYENLTLAIWERNLQNLSRPELVEELKKTMEYNFRREVSTIDFSLKPHIFFRTPFYFCKNVHLQYTGNNKLEPKQSLKKTMFSPSKNLSNNIDKEEIREYKWVFDSEEGEWKQDSINPLRGRESSRSRARSRPQEVVRRSNLMQQAQPENYRKIGQMVAGDFELKNEDEDPIFIIVANGKKNRSKICCRSKYMEI